VVGQVCLPIAYAFIVWGTVMYLWAGAIYLGQVGWIVRNCPLAPKYRPAA
jgi:cardiolipin synthase